MTPPFELGRGAQSALALFGMWMYCAFPAVLLALVGRRSAVADLAPATSAPTTRAA